MAPRKNTASASNLGAAAVGAALNISVLAAIVAATKANNLYSVGQTDGDALVSAGLIEVNLNMPDPNDASKFAARATDAGIKLIDESDEADTAATTATAAASNKPTFEIDDDVPLAPRRGGGGGGTRESIYPFDSLNVGQSFHVAKTADVPHPARTMATAVSQAVRKHAVEDGYETNEDGTVKKNKAGEDVIKWKPTKVFTVRQVGADDKRGEGARIYRTA